MEEKNRIKNIENLWKWDKGDWFWIVFMILLLLLAWTYHKDVEACKEIIKQHQEDPCKTCRELTTNTRANTSIRFMITDEMNMTLNVTSSQNEE